MVGKRGKPLRGQREEIYGQFAASERADTHSRMPARIVDFDAENQTATVEILHTPTINGKQVPIPQLLEVPVATSRGGGFAMTLPIKAGDPGEVVFAERNMDAWYESGEASAADNLRMHDLSDALFVPGGMVSKPEKLPGYSQQYAEIRSLDGQFAIRMAEDGRFALVGSEGELYHLATQICEQIEKLCTAVAGIAGKLNSEPAITLDYTGEQVAATEVDADVAEIRGKLDAMRIE